MNKKILLGLMMLLLITSVFGYTEYSKEDIVPIYGQYTEAGILASANANLTITLPDGTIDVNSQGLNSTETGIFTGSYQTGNQTGVYKALVVFYDDEWTELGRDTQYFEIVEGETLSIYFWPFLVICIVLIVVAFVLQQALLGILAGLGMVFVAFMLTGAAFVITIIAGCLIALSALLIES